MRHIYTVIREFDVPDKKVAEETEAFGAFLDETGEYLYGGCGPETITARLYFKRKGLWVLEK